MVGFYAIGKSHLLILSLFIHSIRGSEHLFF